LIVIFIEIKIQIDQRIQGNRRISCGEIAFEIGIRVLKDTAQYRLKGQAETFCSDEMKNSTEQNRTRSCRERRGHCWLNLQELIHIVCCNNDWFVVFFSDIYLLLFVFLALQPFVVVFS
jgi:hypothetical protein